MKYKELLSKEYLIILIINLMFDVDFQITVKVRYEYDAKLIISGRCKVLVNMGLDKIIIDANTVIDNFIDWPPIGDVWKSSSK